MPLASLHPWFCRPGNCARATLVLFCFWGRIGQQFDHHVTRETPRSTSNLTCRIFCCSLRLRGLP